MQPSNVRFLHSAPRARARGTDQQEASAVSVLVAKRRTRARWFVGAMALAAVIATFASIESNLNREIRDLPTAQRTALYLRTLDTLRTTCEQVARGADDDRVLPRASQVHRAIPRVRRRLSQARYALRADAIAVMRKKTRRDNMDIIFIAIRARSF